MKNLRTLRGFTVIELAVVSLVLAIMGGAVFSVAARGIELWSRGVAGGAVEREAVFELERLAREVRGSFEYPGIPFEGRPNGMAFAALVDPKPSGDPDPWIGRVFYIHDPKTSRLLKSEIPFSRLASGQKAPLRVALENVREFSLQYFGFDEKTGQLGWKDEAGALPLPLALRATILIHKDGNEKQIAKTIYFVEKR